VAGVNDDGGVKYAATSDKTIVDGEAILINMWRNRILRHRKCLVAGDETIWLLNDGVFGY